MVLGLRKNIFKYVSCFCLTISVLVLSHNAVYAFGGISSCNRIGWFQEGSSCDLNSGDHCRLEDQVYDAEDRERLTVSHYVRDGHEIRDFKHIYNQQGYSYQATLDAICGGTSTAGGGLGEWSMKSYTGLCWGRHELLSGQNCSGQILGRTFNETTPTVINSRINRCASGCCTIEEQTGDDSFHAVTGATGDPMMAMFDETQVFHEYKANGCNDLNWVDREGKPGPDNPLMIPSGCAEYRSFMAGNFGGAVEAKAACRSANLSICPTRPSPPSAPTHTGCGNPGGRYGSLYSTGSNIPASWQYSHNSDYNEVYSSCSGTSCVPKYEWVRVCEETEPNCIENCTGGGCCTGGGEVCNNEYQLVDACHRCQSYTRRNRVSWNHCSCGTVSSHTAPPPSCSTEC